MFSKTEQIVFDTLLEAVSEAAIVVDKLQKIRIVNSSVKKIYGYEKDELLEKPLETLIPGEHKKRYIEFFKIFFS